MEFARSRYIQKLTDMEWNGLVKVVTGARRAGKSYLLNELFYSCLIKKGVSPNHIIRFAFDADEDIDKLEPFAEGETVRLPDRKMGYFINAKVFRRFLSSLIVRGENKYYVILDEVQYLDNFVGTLNSYLRHKNVDLYVTGSNSKFLSADIATEFKGRSAELHVFPLTFSEYVEGTRKDIVTAWSEYMLYGGIPLVASMHTEEEQIRYLKNLSEETYLKDIIKRNSIRKTVGISDTFHVLASLMSRTVNPTNISNTFRSLGHGEIVPETVSRFISCFADAFVLTAVRKYSVKGRRYIASPFKVYFEDVGVRNAVLDFRQIEESHILENILYNELRYRGFNVSVGEVDIREDTGRKDKNHHAIYASKSLEVDFIATRGSRKYYIQSALAINTPEKERQEKRSLYYIDDSFKKIVVTKNGLKLSRDEKGVVTMDVFEFLMNEDSLDY